MNEAYDNILKRRSIRKYSNKKIGSEQITKLLEAAMAAPSANQTDPWRFIVITNKDKLSQMAQSLSNGRKMLEQTSCAILVCGNIEKANRKLESYMLQDCSAAIQNILLAATAMELGSCWIGVHPNEDRMSEMNKIFPQDSEIVPISVITLGYPEENLPLRTRYSSEYVTFSD